MAVLAWPVFFIEIKVCSVKFLIDNWMLMAVALTSGLALLWPVVTQGNGLSMAQAVMLMNRDKAVVVDVSEPDEFARGYVLGAKNVPLAQLQAQLPQVAKNKSAPLILVCQSGARSGRATAVARKLGYENVQNLNGGMKAWQAASLPVVTA
jgi:rhodanese-related sulfurtransferase